ncbi:hypothetical protein BHE74_00039161, partial [Ensete ventricosum]
KVARRRGGQPRPAPMLGRPPTTRPRPRPLASRGGACGHDGLRLAHRYDSHWQRSACKGAGCRPPARSYRPRQDLPPAGAAHRPQGWPPLGRATAGEQGQPQQRCRGGKGKARVFFC